MAEPEESSANPRCRLYLITPPVLEPASFADALEAALDGGDVACLQLRLKDVDDDAIRRATDILRPIAQDRDVAFIMNDRPDLAKATGCASWDDRPTSKKHSSFSADRSPGRSPSTGC